MNDPDRERVAVPGEDGSGRLNAAQALLLLAIAFLLLPTVGGLLQGRLGILGVGLSELLLVALPALVAVKFAQLPPRSALGLGWPSWRAIAGAVIAGVAGFYFVAGGLELLQERVAPLPPELRDRMRELIVPSNGPRPLVVDVVVLALLPALCEEALFRGALLRAIAPIDRRHGRTLALLFTSLTFGAFHFSLYKLLPTTALGALLGVIALRSASLWPSVVAHALNNVLVLLLLRAGYDDPPGAGSRLGFVGVALAAPAMVLGLSLIRPPARLPR